MEMTIDEAILFLQSMSGREITYDEACDFLKIHAQVQQEQEEKLISSPAK
jgi:hypothetical protein